MWWCVTTEERHHRYTLQMWEYWVHLPSTRLGAMKVEFGGESRHINQMRITSSDVETTTTNPRCYTEAELLQSSEHWCSTEDPGECQSTVKSVNKLICYWYVVKKKSAHPKSVGREAAPWKPNTPVVPSPKITSRDIQEIPRRYSKRKRRTPRRLISE